VTATAIIGAQWGSEGKGVVAAALAGLFDGAVRVGGPNAGHSFRVLGGGHRTTEQHDCFAMDCEGAYRTHVQRGVPCAWINPECDLFIGAGAVVDPVLLGQELDLIPANRRVYVDAQAAIVTHDDAMEEAGSGLWEAIGSTNEGVGLARRRKIRRRPDLEPTTASDWPGVWHPSVRIIPDVSQVVAGMVRSGQDVMLEGTQGSGLSLHHGTYPKVTSEDTNVSGMLAQIGLPPTAVGHTFLVARTLPIRVAGNSGPMGEEVTWDEVAAQVPGLAPEKTTVTKRIRRISRWDNAVFDRAVSLNDPCGVFLMFADYLVPGMSGTTDADALLDAAEETPLGDLRALTSRIEHSFRVPIVAYGTGGPGWSLAFRGRCAHGQDWSNAA